MSAAQQMWDGLDNPVKPRRWLELRVARFRWLRTTREALWDKWGGRCAFCRCELAIRSITIDHICPKRWDGTDEFYNLRPLCNDCHLDLNDHDQCAGAMFLSWMMLP